MLWSDQSWFVLLIDVAIKSTVLAGLAWMTMASFRIRNANIRHRVWSAVLLGMLVMPLLVPLTPTIPLPRWMTETYTSVAGVPDVAPVAATSEQLATVLPEDVDSQDAPVQSVDETPETQMLRPEELRYPEVALSSPPTSVRRPQVSTTAATTAEINPDGQIAGSTQQKASLPPNWPNLLLAGYALIAGGLLVRILLGIICLRKIVQSSIDVTCSVSQRIDGTYVSEFALLESDDLRVPLTVGVFRSRILLPTEWRSWSAAKLGSVLAHESAHIRRGDVLVTMLSEFNRAIHWFHPLAWLLRHWLSDLAEQNCDDAVIASTGERTAYARYLLEVAASLSDQNTDPGWSGVAMARKANVESRIDSILDSDRPLAKRLSIVGATLLVLVATPAIFLAASLRPATVSAESTTILKAQDTSTTNITLVLDENGTVKCGVVKGCLVTPDGTPITHVGIGIRPPELKDGSYETIMSRGTTDKDGNFAIEHFTPSAAFTIYATSQEPEVVAGSVEIQPGESRDLGEITLKKTSPRKPPSTVWDYLSENPEERDEDKPTQVKTKEKTNGSVAADFVQLAAPAGVATDRRGDSAPAVERAENKPIVYESRVLLPDGTPAVGADIYLCFYEKSAERELPANLVATTDRNGRFRYEIVDVPSRGLGAHVVAKLPGYAYATANSIALDNSGQVKSMMSSRGYLSDEVNKMLKLDQRPMHLKPDDSIIRGRIVDLEGNGVADASVSVAEVFSNLKEDSSTWDQAIQDPKMDFLRMDNAFLRQIRGPRVASMFGVVKTARDGSFEIRGLGKHRMTKLVVRGKNIEATSFYARTTPGKTIKLPFHYANLNPIREATTYYGNRFSHVVVPSRPIIGRVFDKETGKPVSRAVVNSSLTWDSNFDGGKIAYVRSGSDDVWAVTDEDGKFRLEGLPRVKGAHVRVVGGRDYLPKPALQVDTSGSDLNPAKVNFQLERGMVLEGRVLNSVNGLGVEGFIRYFRNASDPRIPPMRSGSGFHRTRADGSFRMVVPKQDGQLAFTANQPHTFEATALAPTEGPSEFTADPPGARSMVDFRASSQFQAIAHVKAKDAPHRLELSAVPTALVTGKAVLPNGKLAKDLMYSGWSNTPGWHRTASGELRVYGMKPGKERLIAVVAENEKMSGFIVLDATQEGFEVKLQPWSALRGRVVNVDGEPLDRVSLQSASMWHDTANVKRTLSLPPLNKNKVPAYEHTTDAEGRFELHGLVANLAYDFLGHHHIDNNYLSNHIAKDVTLQVGKMKDLGDLVLKKMTQEEIDGQIQSSPTPYTFIAEEE